MTTRGMPRVFSRKHAQFGHFEQVSGIPVQFADA
jgi:hypothetical protein